MTIPVQVVWFKKDLRLKDHAPLWEAYLRSQEQQGAVLPLFVYEPEQLQHPEFAPQHFGYLNECLQELQQRLEGLGVPLYLAYGEVVQVLQQLSEQLGHAGQQLAGVWAHQETGNAVSFARDRRVGAWAKQAGIPFYELAQNGVVRRMTNRDGWADEWEVRMTAPLAPTPQQVRATGLQGRGLLSFAEAGLAPEQYAHLREKGGEQLATERLYSFLRQRGLHYQSHMSSPLTAPHACSRLSAALAYGTLSLREVLQATRQQMARVLADAHQDRQWLRSLRAFESRLHWHCHFIQRLESEPRMEFENLNRAYDGLREGHWNEEFFERWATGHTGYPLVDACMRSVAQTGWLNFRMRAMLISFSSHLLWLHWRRTGLHLARLWLDNEPGIHWSQVQMQSGTVGINRVRVYNPTRQAREQDPQGEFIRHWLPELADVPAEFIHAPWEWPATTRLRYPAPVIEAPQAARLAHARLQAVREQAGSREEAARVYQRHGSRKKALIRAERVARGLPAKPPARRALPPQKVRKHPMSDQVDLFGEVAAPKPIVPAGLSADWEKALAAEFSAPYFYALRDFLIEERRSHTIYPPAPDVFNALRYTPLEGVKVLILGQDPYHGPQQAHGLSFSVLPGVRVPPSLANIYKELQADVGVSIPKHGYLRHWAEQGVLLLNAVLTVRAGQANSHAGKGWETLTDAIIRAVDAKQERVVFVLWGAYARKKKSLIKGKQHVILESGHPSPLSVQHFMGTRPFSKANDALQEVGRDPIDWQLPMQAEG